LERGKGGEELRPADIMHDCNLGKGTKAMNNE
jgi:hypothetical protein